MSKLRASTFFCAFSSALLIQGWTIASPSFRPRLLQHPAHPVGAEDAHQIVFEREEEPAGARVALAAGAAAQLVVDAPALVALGADHEQPAGRLRAVMRLGDLGADRRLARRARLVLDARRARAVSRMSRLPPSLMSVPRPAMLVAMVTAPGAPAWATISASCSWKRAFSTACGTFFFFRSSADDLAFLDAVVPTSTGWPRSRASSISVATASYFSSAVR